MTGMEAFTPLLLSICRASATGGLVKCESGERIGLMVPKGWFALSETRALRILVIGISVKRKAEC